MQNGDIFESGCDILVNPVNCVGVMGKGLALEFKNRYPKNYTSYVKICKNKQLAIGKILLHVGEDGQVIFNFPTKTHWKNKSKIEDIRLGLDNMAEVLGSLRIPHSVAIPALGCGLGGLDWKDVKKEIQATFACAPWKIKVYEPSNC